MHSIIYGRNQIEKDIYSKRSSQYSSEERLEVTSKSSLTEVQSTIRYRPFFNTKWFVYIDVDKLPEDVFLESLKLLKHKTVECYFSIDRNGKLYASLAKSDAINAIEDINILNAKFPSRDYIKSILLRSIKTHILQDNVITYIAENVRFDIAKLSPVIDDILAYPTKEILLQDIKKILPPSKSENIKRLIYTLLLSNREDLKEHWRDKNKKLLTGNAGKKKKPYEILDNIELPPNVILDIIIKILLEMTKIKYLVSTGRLSETNVFDKKEKLEFPYPYLKAMSIPAIREYIQVSSEVTKSELEYFTLEFTRLLSHPIITEDTLFLKVHQLMTRYK